MPRAEACARDADAFARFYDRSDAATRYDDGAMPRRAAYVSRRLPMMPALICRARAFMMMPQMRRARRSARADASKEEKCAQQDASEPREVKPRRKRVRYYAARKRGAQRVRESI